MSTTDHLLELAGRYADGSAGAQDVQELNAALRSDPDFRRQFLLYLNVDAALASASDSIAGGWDAPPGAAPAAHRAGWKLAPWRWAAAAVLLLGLILIVWRPGSGRRQVASPIPAPATMPAPPALLVASTGARWADPDVELSLRSGDTPAGLLRLEAGVAEFRFENGATAVFLGPAAVRFSGPSEMFLQEGKVLCRCPTEASRVTLYTPATKVVDLGTEFAVDVPPGQSATQVAVVSGAVRVGTADARVLRKGQAAVVGADRVLRLTPLPADTLAQLLATENPHGLRGALRGPNLLRDPGFAGPTTGGPWVETEGYAEPLPGGAAAVHARSHRLWPSFRQTVATGEIGGRLVVATVRGTSAPDDPLCERQSAILKISFLDAGGREFASASRHFLQAGAAPGVAFVGNVAAFAPAGTREIQYQLMLTARGQPHGTVIFDDPKLFVAADHELIDTRP